MLFDAIYCTRRKIVQCFDQECERYQKERAKWSFSLTFLDPSLPRLASGSPGPLEDFSLKEPARLGEPVTSGVSLCSPGRAAVVPNALFSINRREGELRKRFQGAKGEGIERREKEQRIKAQNRARKQKP